MKRKFVIKCWVPVHPEIPIIYGDMIEAKKDLRNEQLLNPQNMYLLEELEEDSDGI